MLDIKIPIGLMFSLLGIVVLVYGIFTNADSEMYKQSFNININIWMGSLMLVFGGIMLLLTRKKKQI